MLDHTSLESLLGYALALLLAPLLAGLILRVKAWAGGRKGSPLLIHYFTLAKLLRKGSVYSTSTTRMFKLGPVVSLATVLLALAFVPLAGAAPLLSFEGDVVLVLYLLGLGRFFTIAAALDTGSPFEGMGAAREATFPIICEAALFMILILFHRLTGGLSLGAFLAPSQAASMWGAAGPSLLFAVLALFIVLLTESSRVPVDDPSTHLELTMIHEVMILDHSGPDLAAIEFGASLKLFFYAALIAQLVHALAAPSIAAGSALFVGVLVLIYLAIGVSESVIARYRMDRVPKFVLTSFALAAFALVLTLEAGS
ncbi:MAG: NADH-quinone oxidoreductase subunit H [Pseudomonadota bacterium]